MKNESSELREIMADLKLIKKAVSKSDSILGFLDIGGVFRGILLAVGLLIAAFSAFFYFFLEKYGSFEAIPLNVRMILFALIGLSMLTIGYLKIRNLMRQAQKFSTDKTIFELIVEIYSPRFLALLLPNLFVILLVIIFVANRGYNLYIIPSFAVLFGLLIISLNYLLLTKEIYYSGLWLTVTGILTLFLAEAIHPLAVLSITLAAGCILASILLYLNLPGENR
jgi:hypothetical protein